MSTRQSDRDHAIVIGGSMMGLLAARVLAHHFQRVTVIERDRLPTDVGPRKGVPQGRHAHGLLAYGLTNLEALFPGLEDQLVAAGAIPGDIAETLRWYQHGAFKLQFRSGFHGVLCSRPLLESVVRQCVLTVPNVTWRDGYQVARLLASSDRSRVTGVVVRHATSSDENGAAEELLTAALIVDATGRGSRAPAWLEGLGFSRPPETSVTIDVGYATRIFRRSPGDVVGADAIVVTGVRPPAIDAINWYVTQVQKASAQDSEVYRAFLHVMNLQKAPPSIFAPRVAWRVARAAFVRGQQRRMASFAPVPA